MGGQPAMVTGLPVIELRNYLLADGAAEAFMRYFEEHFLFSQREAGMTPLGQFAVVGAPNRFVWIRGFADMQARLHALSRFYGGPFWLARRDHANAMMREHHDVHLLRPLGPVSGLISGRALEDRAGEPPGVIPAHTGLVCVDFYRGEPGARDRLVERFEHQVAPALVEQGHRILGRFVAEPTANDYPRLPVIQDPSLLVVLSAYRDAEHQAALRENWGEAGAPEALWPLLTAPATTLCLRPTARSLIRPGGPAPSEPSP
jgi:hypothetical protein